MTRLRATDDTRRPWGRFARSLAYSRGIGAEFDRLCGEIESRLIELHDANAATGDRPLTEIGELARQRSALLTESATVNG